MEPLKRRERRKERGKSGTPVRDTLTRKDIKRINDFLSLTDPNDDYARGILLKLLFEELDKKERAQSFNPSKR